MSLQLLKIHVDIYNFPVVDQVHRSDTSTQLTIGDLHGNAIKLLYFLLKQGVVNNITEKDYIELVSIYRYENLNRPGEISFVHGHDSNERSENNIFNLDNFLGKGEQENKDEYAILFSHEVVLSELLHKLNHQKNIV